MNINHVIGNIFTTHLMDDNFGADKANLNTIVITTIHNSSWINAVKHTIENTNWIAWEAFIKWVKDEVAARCVEFDDSELRETVGIWFTAVFGDLDEAFQPAVTYINSIRANAQKEEESTMKNTITITDNTIDLSTIGTDVVCEHCGCIVATPEAGEVEAYKIVGNKVYCEACCDELFIECAECGELIPVDDAVEINGEYYCESCVEENFVKCEHCGEYVRRDEATEADGYWYCEDCRDEVLCWCEDCAEYHEECNGMYVDSVDRWVCGDCLERYFTRCDRCGDYFPYGDTITVIVNDRGHAEEWCAHCTEYHTWTCDECGETYSDDVDYIEDGYDHYCRDCRGCAQDTGDINSWRSPRYREGYYFKPAPCLCATESERSEHGSDWMKDIIFYGFELEIDRKEKCHRENEWSAKIVDALPSTYCKKDCSLDRGGDYSGIEIVSHPATLAWYEERKADFDSCFDMLKEGGWLSHDARTCGLHVHISLHALEAANSYAINNMLYLVDRFWDKLVKFSRRTADQLDHWAKRYSVAHGTYEEIKNMAKRDRDRYMAVNLTNEHTVEIRMFRGTLNLETFFATLQLIDVLVKRCIELGDDYRRLQAISWEEFIASDHAELNSYLKRRGLVEGCEEQPEPPEGDEEAERTIERCVDWAVGDRVMVNLAHNACADVPDRLCHGVIRGFDGDAMNIAVELDSAAVLDREHHIWCHSCNGLCREENGRWFLDNELRLETADDIIDLF